MLQLPVYKGTASIILDSLNDFIESYQYVIDHAGIIFLRDQRTISKEEQAKLAEQSFTSVESIKELLSILQKKDTILSEYEERQSIYRTLMKDKFWQKAQQKISDGNRDQFNQLKDRWEESCLMIKYNNRAIDYFAFQLIPQLLEYANYIKLELKVKKSRLNATQKQEVEDYVKRIVQWTRLSKAILAETMLQRLQWTVLNNEFMTYDPLSQITDELKSLRIISKKINIPACKEKINKNLLKKFQKFSSEYYTDDYEKKISSLPWFLNDDIFTVEEKSKEFIIYPRDVYQHRTKNALENNLNIWFRGAIDLESYYQSHQFNLIQIREGLSISFYNHQSIMKSLTRLKKVYEFINKETVKLEKKKSKGIFRWLHSYRNQQISGINQGWFIILQEVLEKQNREINCLIEQCEQRISIEEPFEMTLQEKKQVQYYLEVTKELKYEKNLSVTIKNELKIISSKLKTLKNQQQSEYEKALPLLKMFAAGKLTGGYQYKKLDRMLHSQLARDYFKKIIPKASQGITRTLIDLAKQSLKTFEVFSEDEYARFGRGLYWLMHLDFNKNKFTLHKLFEDFFTVYLREIINLRFESNPQWFLQTENILVHICLLTENPQELLSVQELIKLRREHKQGQDVNEMIDLAIDKSQHLHMKVWITKFELLGNKIESLITKNILRKYSGKITVEDLNLYVERTLQLNLNSISKLPLSKKEKLWLNPMLKQNFFVYLVDELIKAKNINFEKNSVSIKLAYKKLKEIYFNINISQQNYGLFDKSNTVKGNTKGDTSHAIFQSLSAIIR